MTSDKIQVPGEIAIKVAIGEVCIQWARLEMVLFHLICVVEPMELEKGYVIYGGLDMLPRATMALNLARQNKLHHTLTKRIEGIRKSLQNGLLDRRNQVVHGAHKGQVEGASVTLTMVRWKGDKRERKISATEISELAREIHELGNQGHAILLEIIARSVRKHMKVDFDDLL